LAQLRAILDDREATHNDRFVAYDLSEDGNIAAGGVLPVCQDTGTAIVMAEKGRRICTEGTGRAWRAGLVENKKRTCGAENKMRTSVLERGWVDDTAMTNPFTPDREPEL
jgi:tartrate dehydratase alpha subunit/fumarate hydratase class I-like protein